MSDVLMPQLGETVDAGTISLWHKQPGDSVVAGDILFEVETDKVAMEVPATEAGVLTAVRCAAGETMKVGDVVAVIGDGSAEAEPAAPAAERPAAAAAAPAFAPFAEVATPTVNHGPAVANGVAFSPLARRLAGERGIEVGELARAARSRGAGRVTRADVEAYVPAAEARRDVADAPSARKLMAENGLARGAVEGTGRDGRVMKEDVLRALAETPAEAEAPAPAPAVAYDDEVQPLNRIRRATAKALATSWVTAPHVFQAVEAPFHRVDAARKAFNAAAGPNDVKLGYLPFIARAVCLALREFPRVNAQLDGERLIVKGRVNLGVAVDLGHEGLVVPVVHGADDLTLRGLARRIDAAVTKARDHRLTADDLEGGTYTISNNGSFGTWMTAPIINPPQVAILSTDAVRKKPVAVETEDGDAVVVRRMGVLGQSFDHRAFDGAYAAAYLHRLSDILATRDWAAEGA